MNKKQLSWLGQDKLDKTNHIKSSSEAVQAMFMLQVKFKFRLIFFNFFFNLLGKIEGYH